LPQSAEEGMRMETDPVLDALVLQPFRILRPGRQLVPFVFAVPHAGRLYPADFLAQSRLGLSALRSSEDAYADELFEGVTASAPLIAARFPRAYVDVNRAAGEIDAQMFETPPAAAASSPRVAAGLGVIARVAGNGAEIYQGKLKGAEAEERLARFYRPYHAALAALVAETVAAFGAAVLVDCHTMPSGHRVPAVVFGDCYGASASPELLRHAVQCFEACGFSTARNTPYAGGFTTHHYAQRERGIHALQIEVNRALYLDEGRVGKGPNFTATRERLTGALAALQRFEIAPRRSEAAE
jgi:N-formylglutamate amidohydrolase